MVYGYGLRLSKWVHGPKSEVCDFLILLLCYYANVKWSLMTNLILMNLKICKLYT